MGKQAAARVYLGIEGLLALIFAAIFTTAPLYRIERLGLDALQLLLVGTVLEAGCLLLEVPTGVIADSQSRRRSVIIGVGAFGAAALLEGAVMSLWATLAAQVVWAVGYTCLSGALQAWIAGEVGDDAAARLFRRGAQLALAASIGGIGLGVGLALIDLRVPYLAGGVALLALMLWLLLRMPENGFEPVSAERGAVASMRATLGAGLRAVRLSPLLLGLAGVAAAQGAWSEGFDRLWQAHFLASIGLPAGLEPVVWFGLLSAGAALAGIIAIEIAERRLKGGASEAGLFVGLIGGLMAASVGFALAESAAWGAAWFGALVAMRRLAEPLKAGWLSRSVEPRVRATVFSLMSQADALGQIALGPLVGLAAREAGLRWGLAGSAGLLAPIVIAAAALAWRRRGSQALRPGA